MAPAIPASFGARQAQPLDGLSADARGVLEGLFGKPDPADIPALAQAAIDAQARIRGIAARLFGSAEGEELLEFLCDHAMRRPFLIVQPNVSAEFATLYAAKREGQAEMIYFLLALIAEGRSEQAPSREGQNHAATSKRRPRRARAKARRK